MYKRQYTDQTLTLWKSIYMRASELRKFWHFYIIKVLFLSIWMGRNNHLQINILKHILRMHMHDFCGEQSIYTRAILANKKICMHDFFLVGGTWGGGTDNLWGGFKEPPPPLWIRRPFLLVVRERVGEVWCVPLLLVCKIYKKIEEEKQSVGVPPPPPPTTHHLLQAWRGIDRLYIDCSVFFYGPPGTGL